MLLNTLIISKPLKAGRFNVESEMVLDLTFWPDHPEPGHIRPPAYDHVTGLGSAIGCWGPSAPAARSAKARGPQTTLVH